MNDDQLRSLIRDVIRRQLAAETPVPGLRPPAAGPWPDVHAHPSHWRFTLARGADGDGPCLIEPAVTCIHCGYCQSRGH